MKPFLLLAIALFGVGSIAHADEPFETIEHSCDVKKNQFKIHYQIYWNEQPPNTKDFSVPGKSSFSCRLGKLRIKGRLNIYQPSSRGMCGGIPGGQIESLNIGGMELLTRMPINSCYSSWLDYVLVQAHKNSVEVTFCGSHYREESGEQPGCFTEKFSTSALSGLVYDGVNFPFDKYQPNTSVKRDGLTAASYLER